MKKYISTLFVCSLVSLSPLGKAGTFIGNGGEGVLKDSKIHLLDFYENAVQMDLKDCKVPISNSQIQNLDLTTDLKLSAKEVNCLSWAFDRLDLISKEFKQLALRAIHLYRWSLVEGEFKTSPVALAYHEDMESVRTVAIRHLDGIRISKRLWEEMDSFHRVGLVFHELIYSMIKPQCHVEQGKTLCSQDPVLVRNLTAQVFQKNENLSEQKSIWLSNLYSDGFAKDSLSEDFLPLLVEHWTNKDTKQLSVFLRQKCNLEKSPTKECLERSKEPVVRHMYEKILLRSASDSEIYWWSDHASQVGLSCERLAVAFFHSKEAEGIGHKDQKSPFESSQKTCREMRQVVLAGS